MKFCEESGLPVALDETIDNCRHDPLKMLADYVHPGIVAVVSGQYSFLLVKLEDLFISVVLLYNSNHKRRFLQSEMVTTGRGIV